MAKTRKSKFDEHSNVNDTYSVKRRLAEIVEELEDLYSTDVTKFYSYRKTKSAGTRSRARIRGVQAALKDLSTDILKQRQDYSSDYE
jgi:hypothetical protein